MKITSRWTGAVLWEGECENVREELVAAVKAGASLYGASLYGASLTGASLTGASLDGASLTGANLAGANLYGADLSRADLSGANLYGANLYGANLSGANLSGANLSGANLSGANLSGADGVIPARCTPLLMLLDQPGPIRAYKLVTHEWTGPTYPGITYSIGGEVEVPNANTSVGEHCGAGINVASLDWCCSEWKTGYHILVVEFTAADIAAIPTGTDGKFRLHRCRVVGEKNLVELGLVSAEAAEGGGGDD